MREQMNIVIVGHVDHGKSTVIGRLLADTKSLPDGKLEEVKERCRRESKTFEYAFLLDALKDEQSQGITIDSARCFFKSKNRDYIIIDAPGHIEFLKNMISGAARAEGALLVIDAKEGIKENSRRHGYMLSMLGIKQVVVCINKMDLVGYSKDVYDDIRSKYSEFLKKIGVSHAGFLPVSGLNGDNIAQASANMKWYSGSTVLSVLDEFKKAGELKDRPLRMPVQDVYKFTRFGDSRRIIAGRVESGLLSVGDKVVFYPSGKNSKISSIEAFNDPKPGKVSAGHAAGVTLAEQIYVRRGEIMCKADESPPKVGQTFRANIFWMGKTPLIEGKEYKLKILTKSSLMIVKTIGMVLDASDLSKARKNRVERHEVAECIIESVEPMAFDLADKIEASSRLVIVDNYDISGGGIITELIEDKQSIVRKQVLLREERWERGHIQYEDRVMRYGQKPRLILMTGPSSVDKKAVAKSLEKELFSVGKTVYYLGIGNILRGIDADIYKGKQHRKEHIRRLGEVAHILMDAGLIVIATASDLSDQELQLLQAINDRSSMFIICIGEMDAGDGMVDMFLDPDDDGKNSTKKIMQMLKFKNVMFSI